jgi:hypothetical protein
VPKEQRQSPKSTFTTTPDQTQHIGTYEKGFSAVLYSLQLNPVHSFFSLYLILLNKIIMNGGDVNWTSSSYISTGGDLL